MPPRYRLTGEQLLASVLDLVAWRPQIRVVHFRAAWTEKGYRTPVSGDGEGYQDLTLIGPGGLLLREVKGERESPTAPQRGWAGFLSGCPLVDFAVWRPRDWFSGLIRSQILALCRTPTVGG